MFTFSIPFMTSNLYFDRLSYGLSTRCQRIAPNEDLKYGSWSIPAGVSDLKIACRCKLLMRFRLLLVCLLYLCITMKIYFPTHTPSLRNDGWSPVPLIN